MTDKKTLGIIGGGQLGRMLSEAAIKLGFDVIVVDPTENCPAAQVGAEQIKASLTDKKAIAEMADKVDYLTVEIEHVDANLLAKLATAGKLISPSPTTLKIIQDKYQQKLFLFDHDIKVVKFAELSWDKATAHLRNGIIYIKAKRGAYDGRGNWLVKSTDTLDEIKKIGQAEDFYVELVVYKVKELAVMVAKDTNGSMRTYPLTETIQERSICVETRTPANVPAYIAAKAMKLAEQTVACFEGAGVYGVEMFLTADNEVLINEIAPRVHNSGHYTMDACVTSQFEQHVRAVTGMELGSTDMKVPACVMINILGERDGPVDLQGLEEAEKIEGVSVYIYGKSPTKIDRKMGHINAVGDTIEEARDKAHRARKLITI